MVMLENAKLYEINIIKIDSIVNFIVKHLRVYATKVVNTKYIVIVS